MNKKVLTIINFLIILLIPFNVKAYDSSYNNLNDNINESFYDNMSYINTDTNYKALIEDDTNLTNSSLANVAHAINLSGNESPQENL